MENIKIAFVGKARTGKDTAGEYLQNNYGMIPFAFADELKEEFHSIYNVPQTPKPVRGYQLYGQLMRYVHGEDYWVDKCFEKMEQIKNLSVGYGVMNEEDFMPVITDLRQPNEFMRCKDEGFTIIKLETSREERITRMSKLGDVVTESDLQFETETYVDGFKADYIIQNDKGKDKLYRELDKIMEELKPTRNQQEGKG